VADEAYAFVVAVVGSRDVMSPYAPERLLELLVNRHQDTRKICLVSGGGRGPELAWCQNRGWTLFLEPSNYNRMKRDCALVATADALVVLGDPAPWARLLRPCREAKIPTRVFQTCPRLPRRDWPVEG
jgi:hypothetical protein